MGFSKSYHRHDTPADHTCIKPGVEAGRLTMVLVLIVNEILSLELNMIRNMFWKFRSKVLQKVRTYKMSIGIFGFVKFSCNNVRRLR